MLSQLWKVIQCRKHMRIEESFVFLQMTILFAELYKNKQSIIIQPVLIFFDV